MHTGLQTIMNTAHGGNTSAVLRMDGIKRETGASRSLIYVWIDEGVFPPPVKLGRKFACWPSAEVRQILNARIAGKTTDQMKKLVAKLVEQRKQAAD